MSATPRILRCGTPPIFRQMCPFFISPRASRHSLYSPRFSQLSPPRRFRFAPVGALPPFSPSYTHAVLLPRRISRARSSPLCTPLYVICAVHHHRLPSVSAVLLSRPLFPHSVLSYRAHAPHYPLASACPVSTFLIVHRPRRVFARASYPCERPRPRFIR